MRAVDTLDYRVTVGDVASQAGLDVKQVEQELMALASVGGGHLQVSETGEIVYRFPRNYRAILRNASLRLRLQETWQRIWNVLFYIIRISFGILLILSLVVIAIAIFALTIVLSNRGEGNSDNRGGGGQGQISILPYLLLRSISFELFQMNYYRRYSPAQRGRRVETSRRSGSESQDSDMNFLEAVFSFLFGDGNPNADLSDRRWQHIAAVIRNNGGAVTAEQIAPYLDLPESRSVRAASSDSTDSSADDEAIALAEAELASDLATTDAADADDEDYMLPVLLRFNGRPHVSPDGGIIYHFPELQVMAEQRGKLPVPDYLKEREWKFSLASSSQLTWAGGLGAVNLIGALFLGSLLLNPGEASLQLGGAIGLVDIGYAVLLLYAIAFVTIPLVRYFWVKRQNRRIEQRNLQRFQRSSRLDQLPAAVQSKIDYAHQFASETVVSAEDLAYTTETDLMEQESLRGDAVDEEWRRLIERRQ